MAKGCDPISCNFEKGGSHLSVGVYSLSLRSIFELFLFVKLIA